MQGQSLSEVIIDFESDDRKKKPYIIPGTFYVAITRASKAENVYLKSFKKSYIKADSSIAKKIDAMRVTKPYKFFKIFNDDEVFKTARNELKDGYFNINGVLDGNHNEYLNNDKNLLHLDVLVLAETKLTRETDSDMLATELSSYNILERFDAGDDKKHMGLLILCPKQNEETEHVESKVLRSYRDSSCQVVIQSFTEPINATYAYIYLRPNTGNREQIRRILEDYYCRDCDVIMGDLNLNPRISTDSERLKELCSDNKTLALQEVTTKQKNQLDHIAVNNDLKGRVFVSSFVNFISDHKTIVIRCCTKEEINTRATMS